jgi:isocitrate dehydrogenase
MKSIFDAEYKARFLEAGLLERSGGELQHLISDAATMQLIRWTDGGFGMAAHNYDGDMLTDQIAQVHRSPGFITSNLVGVSADGSLIKEFEASHGTVSDLWHDHLAGKETSLNPLGLVEAMIGAMQHAATLDADKYPDDAEKQANKAKIFNYCTTLREAMHNTFRYGQGTRDMSGPSGFTTEDFIAKVAWRLERYLKQQGEDVPPPKLKEPDRKLRRNYKVDVEALNKLYSKYDTNGDGLIDFEEFEDMMVKLNIAPRMKTDDEEK